VEIATTQPITNHEGAENNGHIGAAGKVDTATGEGDLYVQDALEVDGTAEFSSTVDFFGDIDMNDKRVTNVGTPTQSGDAANKVYVDDTILGAIGTIPSAAFRKRPYTVVLGLRSNTYCPNGYTLESVANLKGPDNYVHISINDGGLYMGGMNSIGHGQTMAWTRFLSTNGMNYVCWKKYNSSSGNPHISIFTWDGMSSNTCFPGYTYIPRSELSGNNNYAYLNSVKGGTYMGYMDGGGYGSHEYSNDTGYNARILYTETTGVCYQIMGVDEDSQTMEGVYPVFLGVQDAIACPSGWNYSLTNAIDSNNNYFYLQVNDNSSYAGSYNNWYYGGNNYMYISFLNTMVTGVCWKYFIRSAMPWRQILTPGTGNCPDGSYSFSANLLKGTNASGYIGSTGQTLYMGGMNSWGLIDYTHGYIQHTYSTQVANKVCLKLENVQ